MFQSYIRWPRFLIEPDINIYVLRVASRNIKIEFVQRRTSPKGQSLCQNGVLENSDKRPAYDQVLLNLGIVNPRRKLTPGDNICFRNHRSPSTSVLIRSCHLIFFSDSAAGSDGSNLVKGGL